LIKEQITIISFANKIKKLHGDPHYVAFGMAIGVFVAITPTIPFHTILAVVLSLLFKASKPAAIIGVWICNPFTVIFLYFACYKTGYIFFEDSLNAWESVKILIGHLESNIEISDKFNYFIEFIQTKIKIFLIMNIGGILLGLPAGAITYFITKKVFVILRQKQNKKNNTLKNDSSGTSS